MVHVINQDLYLAHRCSCICTFILFSHFQDLVHPDSSGVKVVIAPMHIGFAIITMIVQISAMSLAVVCSIPLFAVCAACPVLCQTYLCEHE